MFHYFTAFFSRCFWYRVLICFIVSTTNMTHAFVLEPVVTLKTGQQWVYDGDTEQDKPYSSITGFELGLQLSPQWSASVGLQNQGTFESEEFDISVDTSMYEGAIRFDRPIYHNLNLYFRAGVVSWDIDKNERLGNVTGSGLSRMAEVGADYNIEYGTSLRAGFQYIGDIGNDELGEYDSIGFILGISYSFGSVLNTSQMKGSALDDPCVCCKHCDPLPAIDIAPEVGEKVSEDKATKTKKPWYKVW